MAEDDEEEANVIWVAPGQKPNERLWRGGKGKGAYKDNSIHCYPKVSSLVQHASACHLSLARSFDWTALFVIWLRVFEHWFVWFAISGFLFWGSWFSAPNSRSRLWIAPGSAVTISQRVGLRAKMDQLPDRSDCIDPALPFSAGGMGVWMDFTLNIVWGGRICACIQNYLI